MIGLIANTLGIAAGVLALAVGMIPMRSRHGGEYTTVAYCDLVRNPERYNQKSVRVSAVYRYGYEWSELYCLECGTESKTWVDFDDSFSSSTKASIRKKLGDNGFKGRTVLVTMVGKFDAGSGYGHMGAYRYRLMVDSVEKADVILNDSPSPSALPKKVLSRIHCP
ncbi:MAG: hypothetical protein QOF62_1070 [Pyrinomonadaceae bacterium]|jgi:hypothetical protein|nr:hypothetical protein [Pyrinomonadaceae bacterium]